MTINTVAVTRVKCGDFVFNSGQSHMDALTEVDFYDMVEEPIVVLSTMSQYWQYNPEETAYILKLRFIGG